MRPATVVVDVPRHLLLNANQRLHWRSKAERSRAVRLIARNQAMRRPTFAGKVRCEVLVYWPDRRRRDVHNLTPTIKAAIDGMVDAHLLTDDSDKHLVGPDLRVSDELCGGNYACSLVFTFAEVSA